MDKEQEKTDTQENTDQEEREKGDPAEEESESDGEVLNTAILDIYDW